MKTRSPTESAGFAQPDGYEAEIGNGINLLIYPYERLKIISSDPIPGIDVTKREVLLFVLIN